MNAVTFWEALDRLGFETLRVLLSVLWQSSILLAAVMLIAFALRRRRASARHALWVAALLVAPALPLLGWAASRAGTPQAQIPVMPAYSAPEVEFSPTPPVSSAPAPVPPVEPSIAQEQPQRSLLDYPWGLAFLAYVFGAGAFLSLVMLGRARLRGWVRRGREVEDARVAAAFQFAREHLGLARTSRLMESEHILGPLTLGALRPVVLLPAGLAQGLSDADLRAVAIHELAHVKRRDPLVLGLASLVRAVLFFHPLVWLACRQISNLAEAACDDAVLDATGEPVSYAKMLARLAEELPRRSLSTELSAGIMLSKSAFLRRVEAILSRRRDHIRRLSRLALLATVVAGVISLIVACALPLGQKRESEVARAEKATGEASGEAVEGVQVSLRVDKTAWQGGEVPTFRADVCNMGDREDLRVFDGQGSVELQFDGEWFNATSEVGDENLLAPGKQIADVQVPLDDRWRWPGLFSREEHGAPYAPPGWVPTRGPTAREGEPEPKFTTVLTPGRHTVRIGVVAVATTKGGKPVRAISNPVEIEIFPAWGEAAEGLEAICAAMEAHAQRIADIEVHYDLIPGRASESADGKLEFVPCWMEEGQDGKTTITDGEFGLLDCIWKEKGDKGFLQRHHVTPVGGRIDKSLSIIAWDGREGRTYSGPADTERGRQGIISDRPNGNLKNQVRMPLLFTWRMWQDQEGTLADLFRKGAELLPEREEIDGRLCVVVLVRNHFAGGIDEKYWLDPERGFGLTRFERRDYLGRITSVLSDITLKEVAPDIWYPVQGISYDPLRASKYSAREVKVNQGLPDSDFTLEFPPGTGVTDERNKTKYTMGRRLSFGPVIERAVNADDEGRDFVIDFDSGRVLTPPDLESVEQWVDWARKNGVEGVGSVGKNDVSGIMCMDTVVVPAQGREWDTFSVREVQRMLVGADYEPEGARAVMNAAGKDLPATFVFMTREGGMGILQIVGFTEDPKAVKIRYKMVQQAPGNQIEKPGGEEPPSGDVREGASFGPVIERVVNHTGENCLIDLDSGKLCTLPAEVAQEGSKAAIGWSEKQGIDAGGGMQPEIMGLIGFDVIVFPVRNEAWERMSAANLSTDNESAFKSAKPGNPVFLTGKGELPVTYIFKTREGGMGILQIVGFTEDPKGVKIRYKMVQPHEVEGDSVPRASTEPTASPVPEAKAGEPAGGEAVEGIERRVYDIRDLCSYALSQEARAERSRRTQEAIKSGEAVVGGAGGAVAGTRLSPEDQQRRREEYRTAAEKIARFLINDVFHSGTFSPDLPPEAAGGLPSESLPAISLGGSNPWDLVVLATPAQHERIEGIFTDMRQGHALEVNIEVHAYVVQRGHVPVDEEEFRKSCESLLGVSADGLEVHAAGGRLIAVGEPLPGRGSPYVQALSESAMWESGNPNVTIASGQTFVIEKAFKGTKFTSTVPEDRKGAFVSLVVSAAQDDALEAYRVSQFVPDRRMLVVVDERPLAGAAASIWAGEEQAKKLDLEDCAVVLMLRPTVVIVMEEEVQPAKQE